MICSTTLTNLFLCCRLRPQSHLCQVSIGRAAIHSGNGTNYLGSNGSKCHPLPFPTHASPTPHEIFHLPRSATAAEIKSRYYDLVRYHHPDSPYARTHTPSPDERHTRFQSILSAYHFLRYPSAPSTTRNTGRGHYGHGPGFDPFMNELNRRRRTSEHAEWTKRRKQGVEDEARAREQAQWNKTAGGLRERLMMALGVVAVIGGLYPSFVLFPFRREQAHQDAVVNLTQARSDAQEVGHLRREEVRKRVKDIKAAREQERPGSNDETST